WLDHGFFTPQQTTIDRLRVRQGCDGAVSPSIIPIHLEQCARVVDLRFFVHLGQHIVGLRWCTKLFSSVSLKTQGPVIMLSRMFSKSVARHCERLLFCGRHNNCEKKARFVSARKQFSTGIKFWLTRWIRPRLSASSRR